MDRVIVRASNYAAATFIFVIVSVTQGAADSATWSTNPGSGDYNLTANWSGSIASAPGFAIYNSPLTVSPDTATFGSSSIKTLSLDGNLFTLDGWKFTTEASDYIFNVHNVLTFQGAGIVVNGGSVSIDNSNFLFFENSSTAGKATIANEPNSALIFGGNSSAGHASIINSSGGVTYFIGSSTGADASIENSDGGGTFFDNNSTAGNASIVNKRNGFTVIGDNATAGNASIVTNAGGYTDFSPSTGPNGDNKLSAGSIAGDGFYYLGANELTVGSNNLSTSVSGVISDCGSGGSDCNTPGQAGGSLVKVGTGTLTLAGVNIYTGSTTVNGGTLEVDGSIASPIVTVNSGGTLAGTGTTGNSLINAGGTLAPGSAVNPYGAMAINGSLTFAAGSFYNVNISPAVNSGASVTGAATLGGATVNARYADGSYVAKQYTILTAAGGVSGAFNSLVNTNLPSGFKASLGYDADNTYLNLSLSFAPPSSPNFGSGLTANQQGVGNALVNFFNTTGGIPLVYGTLTPTGLTQISGEVATASQQSTFDAMNLFMGAMTDPFSHGGSATSQTGVSSYAAPRDANAMFTKAMPVKAIPFTQRWNVWAAGFGSSQDTDGNAATGSSHAVSRVFGTAVGADYSFSPATVAGFALAGGGTNFGVTNAGSGHSDLFQAGAFVRHTAGAAYVSAALAYGWQDVTTNRTLAVAGVDQLQARFNANAYSGRLESGYRVVAPWLGGVGITPYAAAQFTTFALPAYAENVVAGANTFALAYAARSVTDTRSELGLRTDKSYALSNAALTLRGRVAWAHDFNPDRGIAATFQALPGASFVVNGAAQARDAALTTASAELKWMNGWSAVATFEGEFSDVTRSYAGKGVVRYAW